MFGVFATETFAPHHGHYGTGECFLWRLEEHKKVHKYGTTAKNNFFLLSEQQYLAAGVGESRYGLWLDEALLYGQSDCVSTFDNDVLSSRPSFKCVNIEVWGLLTNS